MLQLGHWQISEGECGAGEEAIRAMIYAHPLVIVAIKMQKRRQKVWKRDTTEWLRISDTVHNEGLTIVVTFEPRRQAIKMIRQQELNRGQDLTKAFANNANHKPSN